MKKNSNVLPVDSGLLLGNTATLAGTTSNEVELKESILQASSKIPSEKNSPKTSVLGEFFYEQVYIEELLYDEKLLNGADILKVKTLINYELDKLYKDTMMFGGDGYFEPLEPDITKYIKANFKNVVM